MGPTANEIKAQLKTLLVPVIGTSGTYKVQILDYLAMAFEPEAGEDIDVLRSSLDTATTVGGEIIKRVNSLMIVEDGFTQAPPQRDSTRGIETPRGRNTISRRFWLGSFYQFGKVAQNDPNVVPSENIHSEINEAIRTTINNNPKLGFAMVNEDHTAGPGEFIEGHDAIQNPSPYRGDFAGTVCHVSLMGLTVRVIESLG